MKILHTADWHLGNVFHGYSRSEEHAHFFRWLLEVLRQRQPDVLVISGDIFDSANPSAAAERQFYDFLTDATMAVEGLQIVAIAGNHDSGGRIEAPAELLRRHNVYVRGIIRRNEDTGEPDFEHYILPLSSRVGTEAEVVCFALPFLRSCDYPIGKSPTEGIAWYLEHFCRALRKSDFNALPVIVAAHFYAAGAEICENEHSERLVIGGQEAVNVRGLDCGASYTALGHIHKAQCVGGADSGVYYSGSALPMSFSERHYRHGVQWVEMTPDGRAEVSRVVYTPLRGLQSIPESGATELDNVLEQISTLPRREKNDDGLSWPYLELRVRESRPQPSMMRQIADALADRAVRFCRIVREWPEVRPEMAETSMDEIQRLSPLDMAQRVYKSRYNAPMPEKMEKRFKQAMAGMPGEENDGTAKL